MPLGNENDSIFTFGIALILLGIFLVIEAFQSGFGIFGILETISLLLGIFILEAESFFSPKIFEAMAMMVMGAVITIAILFVIISKGGVKSLRGKPKVGPKALIGKIDKFIRNLNPQDQVQIKGEI